MSLYENALFNIYNLVRNHKISDDKLVDLPEKIENDLQHYLTCEIIEKCFHYSLSREHFIFADFFLSQIIDKLDAVNHSLRYAKNKNIAQYLISKGAIDFDYGLLGAIKNNDMEMIQYFRDLGADDYNNALRQAVIENNIKLIEYFIHLGADDFNGAMATATEFSDYILIKYFLDKGANDFKETLIVASWHGFEDLVEFYLNLDQSFYDPNDPNDQHRLGADDIILALGCAIDNGNFVEALIPAMQPIQACILGDALLYFFRHTNFFTKSGLQINHLIPYMLEGYAERESVFLLMKLYLLNQHNNHSHYFIAFNNFPSLYNITIKEGKKYFSDNKNGNNTFCNIKKYHLGFYPQYVDKLYFPNIIELNIRKNPKLDQETQEQLWKEFIIIKSVVDLFDY